MQAAGCWRCTSGVCVLNCTYVHVEEINVMQDLYDIRSVWWEITN